MADENVNGSMVDLSSLGAFDFAPSWTTGDKIVAKQGRGGFRDEEDRPSRDSKPRRRDDRPGRDERSFKSQGDRAPRRGGKDGDGRFPGKGGNADRRGPRDGGFQRRERILPLDADVRILPGQKDLGGIIRKILSGYVAYPFKQVALFFLEHPEACCVKVTPKDPQFRFRVCKACGFSSSSQEALEAHVLSEHLKDYYTVEEIEVEPPSGKFGCVVKCGITGELIGPPNLHGYNSAVREMARKLGMDEAAYRARLVTVRDEESVELWRKSATKKTIYRLKTAETAAAEEGGDAVPAQAFDRDQAEAAFRRDIMPQLCGISKSSDVSLETALKSDELPYLFAVRDAVARERRFPRSLFFALRGAFYGRKLAFFRANDPHGQEFVCAVKPSPLDVEHAIPELAAVVKWVGEHPFCNANEVPAEMQGHLGWLVEKGHIVKFFNGQLALPEENPKFRNAQQQKKARAEEVKEEKKEEVSNEAADKLA